MFNAENTIKHMALHTRSSQLALDLPHNTPSLRNRSAP